MNNKTRKENLKSREEKSIMKKFITLAALLITLSNTSVLASEIPLYSVPIIATDESVEVTENIIGDILEQVQNGLGYGIAQAMANTRIRKAVLEGQSKEYSYTVLSATASNAMRQARDMYLRPEFYAENEVIVRELLSDLIYEVANGVKDYQTAKNEAYIRLYQSADPSFNPEEQFSIDVCYRDMPPVSDAMFTIARKVLTESIK